MKMIDNINASEDQNKYVGQVCQEEYARLRSYFLAQLGDESLADDFAHKTLRRLFFFMEDRDWEAEAEYISVYIWRIAGFLCSRKLSEKMSRCAISVDDYGNKRAFNKVRVAASQVIKGSIEFMKPSLRLIENQIKQAPEVQRFEPTAIT